MVGRGDGTRCPGLHRHPPTVRHLPSGRRMRMAAGWQPGAAPAAVAASPTRAPTGNAGVSSLPCSGTRTGRCPAHIDAAWPDDAQRARALAALISDGLAERHPDGGYALPEQARPARRACRGRSPSFQ